jgi:hypothetical protein
MLNTCGRSEYAEYNHSICVYIYIHLYKETHFKSFITLHGDRSHQSFSNICPKQRNILKYKA